MNESFDRRGGVALCCSCGCTFGRISAGGDLVIVSRHHGKKCVNVLTLEEFLKLRQEVDSKK